MRIKVINPNTTAAMTDKIGRAAQAVVAPGMEAGHLFARSCP
jgi:allantoin racemase